MIPPVKWLARQKVILGYASSVLNMPLLGYVAATQLHGQLQGAGVYVPTWALFAGLCVGVWLVGWALFKLGLLQAESEFVYQINPEWRKWRDK